MNFTDVYSDDDRAMVEMINETLATLLLPIDELGVRLSDPMPAILAGTHDKSPSKALGTFWDILFGKSTTEDVAVTGGMRSNYTETDVQYTRSIRLRLRANDVKQAGITNASLAKTLGISAGTISQVLNGIYASSPTHTLTSLWGQIKPLEKAAPRQVVAPDLRYQETEFVPTETSKLIWIACDQARKQRGISVFCGSPGIGKSEALKEYVLNHSANTLKLELSTSHGARHVLSAICKKLALTPKRDQLDMQEAIIEFFAANTRNWLIIIDEADKPKRKTLEALRYIRDMAAVGITLVGNKPLADQIRTDIDNELTAGRVVFQPETVGALPVGDITKLFKHFGAQLTLADDSAEFFEWLTVKVRGDARLLVNSLLPQIFNYQIKHPDAAISKRIIEMLMQFLINRAA